MITVKKSKTLFGLYRQEGCSINHNYSVMDSTGLLPSYMPIWESLTFNGSSDLVLTEGETKSREVSTYNEHVSNKSLDSSTVKYKKLDITQNDLQFGSTVLLFNFTTQPVTVNGPSGIRKTYSPITNDQMEDFKGKIIVFEITPINTPEFISCLTQVDNYLEILEAEYRKNPNPRLKETYELYDFANKVYNKHRREINIPKSNNLKTVTCMELSSIEVEKMKTDDIYIPCYSTVFSFKTINQISPNPIHSLSGFNLEDVESLLREGTVSAFINDTDTRKGPRFISVAGIVTEVRKINNLEMSEGFYLGFSKDGRLIPELVCTMEDLDNYPHLYKTKEEASTGADLKGLFSQETELLKSKNDRLRAESEANKIELQKQLMFHTNEIDRERNEAERKAHDLRLHYDEQTRLMKLENDKALHSLKLELEQAKTQSTLVQHNTKTEREVMSTEQSIQKNESDVYKEFFKTMNEKQRTYMDNESLGRKHYYDERKYERDSFVETLKTGAAIAGVVATGILLYSKFK